MLVLGRSQVESLLDVDSLIDALAPAMAELVWSKLYRPSSCWQSRA
jgi:hypothetical protein